MRILVCAVLTTALVFFAADSAVADAEAGQGYFTIMGTYMDDDKARGLEDAINGGLMGAGYAINDRWNVEGFISFAYAKSTLSTVEDADHRGIGVDVQRVFRRSESFSPYLLFGAGHFMESQGDVDREGLMVGVGAGFYLDLFSSNISLRGEAKRRREDANISGRYDNLFSLGIHIPFGGPKPMAVAQTWTDSDGDGVEDGSDRCPDTPAGATVDAYGCELDSDGDGVKDSKDQCPGTPAGAQVDARGCELDDDGDGVVNRLDECPGTPEGTPVDRRGCEIKGDYVLKGVNFESNSDRLRPGATAILDQVVETLLKYPEINFEVQGHTDSDGAAAYNEGLSSRRAQTVHDYLASQGVDVSRMTVRGYGESQPIADNSTAEGKAQNRRVVLSVEER